MVIARAQAKSYSLLPGHDMHVSMSDRDEYRRVLGLGVWIWHGTLPCLTPRLIDM
jgi:hypothetical protein